MGGSPATSQESKPYRLKREVPRYALIAGVELTEPGSDASVFGQIAEISRKGCFVNFSKSFPIGTLLKIDISREQGTFTTDATVIFNQDGKGIGLAFQEPAPEQLEILDQWLGSETSVCFYTPQW